MAFQMLAAAWATADTQVVLLAVVSFVVIGMILASMILYTKAKLVGTGAVKLLINQDPSLTRTVNAGDTLLGVLSKQGISIPSPCGGKATCKQCKVQVLAGGGPLLETEMATFSKKQQKEGWRLSCQCKVKNDIEIHVEEAHIGIKEYRGRVVSNHNVATFIKELIVEVPEVIEYRSGAYLQFHVPRFKTNTSDWKATMDPIYRDDWEKYRMFDRLFDFGDIPDNVIRAYSMASYPAEKTTLKFNIRIATSPFVAGFPSESIPWGICSSYTFSLKPGDTLRLSGPYGESYMKDDQRELVFLIGGAGSSFGRSHILHLFRTEKTKRRVSMWYGARSLKENIYQEEYEELAKLYPHFSYHLVLSEPLPEDIEKGWPKNDPVKTNFLFRAFEQGQLKKMAEPEEALYYVCGPPMHNVSVLKLLDDYGVPRDSIVLDDFGS